MIENLPILNPVWILAAVSFAWLGSAAYRSIRNTVRASRTEETA